MIIQLISDIIYITIWNATAIMNIPRIPEEVSHYLGQAMEYIGFGIGILGNFTDIGYLLSLWMIVVAVDAGLIVYKLVMWVLKKIPVSID